MFPKEPPAFLTFVLERQLGQSLGGVGRGAVTFTPPALPTALPPPAQRSCILEGSRPHRQGGALLPVPRQVFPVLPILIGRFSPPSVILLHPVSSLGFGDPDLW